ncbi:serine/threonine protein phosphatase [Devosia pacifica]|uniref:Serine/threonine protein phosphatase n=1 Tax=Devosia pacifica TaxID=1335967 RepID=A0A918SFU9_9HYPH|nr:metallophosphoesterase [Devosia pacifica]GHA37042.1 serine/threonine protein phosphatase [Devosia pacifica]
MASGTADYSLFRSDHALAHAVQVAGGPQASVRPRLSLPQWPHKVYAVGDTHGRFDLLQALLAMIVKDAGEHAEACLIVMLGDYIDRGGTSADVLEWASNPASSPLPRICLAGNHEQLMAEFMQQPDVASPWLANGGIDTLISYGLDPDEVLGAPEAIEAALVRAIPMRHRSFVECAPTYLAVPGALFVHAGVRPAVPLDQQTDHDLLWIRKEFSARTEELDMRVVHGHTPGAEPYLSAKRICVDTGAYHSGILTAACLSSNDEPYFLNT